MPAHKQFVIPKTFTDIGNGASVIKLIDELFEEIYLVGGAVRDEILGVETRDLDFATPTSVEETAKILRKAGLSIREIGKPFGTIGTSIADYDIQITTYRNEHYQTGSRQPTVITGTDIDSDLARRDFTINAMALSRYEFVDPYNGLVDIQDKLIRAVGNADKKFKDDPLRMLRAYRFVSALGFNITSETKDAIKSNLNNIFILSTERIAEELKKLIAGQYWSDALYEAAASKVLETCLKNFDIKYSVTEAVVQSSIESYSLTDLEKMTDEERWHLFFVVLCNAERSSGVSTVDVVSIVQGLGHKLQLGKPKLAKILALAEQQQITPTIAVASKVVLLENEYADLVKVSDSRSKIVLAKLHREKGKDAYRSNMYGVALREFESAILANEANLEIILNQIQHDETYKIRLTQIKDYIISDYGLYLASLILHEKLYRKFESSDNLMQYLLNKKFFTNRLSRHESVIAVEKALIRVYEIHPAENILEPYEKFLALSSYHLSEHSPWTFPVLAQRLGIGSW